MLTLVAHPVDERGERRRLLRVHAGRRLVEQQQLRLQGQRPGDLEPALVAVRKVLGELVVGAADADELEQLLGRVARLALLVALPGQPQDRRGNAALQVRVHRHHHVLGGRHGPEQPDVLERAGHARAARSCAAAHR